MQDLDAPLLDGALPPGPDMMVPMPEDMGQPAVPPAIANLNQLIGMENCADLISEERRRSLAERVIREYKIDKASRSEWEAQAKAAMDAAKQTTSEKSFPWPKASNVKFPLLTTASLQFAARAYPAIVDGPLIVRNKALGADPQGAKKAMAERTSQHMSYQLLYELPEWESDMDTLLHQLPIVGCSFKKVYHDPLQPAGLCDELVSANDVVVHQKTKSLERVPRITHVFTRYPSEIDEKIRAGLYLELQEAERDQKEDDSESPETLLEQHRNFDFDEDGVTEPWIVTVHENSETVVRMVPNWRPDQIATSPDGQTIVKFVRRDYFVKYDFIPDPEGGFYSIGFGKLLMALSDVIDTSINQMMDAGTLQNAGGGFIGSGLKLGKSKVQLRPGEYRTVQGSGADIRQAIVNLEHPGPSSVLFNLLSLMIDAGKDIAAIQDILVGDMPRNQTATATMAMIEQGLKVFTAIYKRIFRALKQEYALIYGINREYLDEIKYVALLDMPVEVTQSDYLDDVDVAPVADPSMVTDMQKMAKAQFLLEQLAAQNPFLNGYAATRTAYEIVGIENLDQILPPPQPKPADELAMRGAVAEVATTEATAVKTQAEAVLAQAEAEQAEMVVEDERFAKNVTSELSAIVNSEMEGASDALPAEAGPAPPMGMPMLPDQPPMQPGAPM